jgi:hypothetical protein
VTVDVDHPILVETRRILLDAAAAVSLEVSGYKLPVDFLHRIGCPFLLRETRSQALPVVAAEDKAATLAALPHLLTLVQIVGDRMAITDMHSILTGLHSAGGWEECLSAESTTYALAVSLYYAIGTFQYIEAQDWCAKPAVLQILNQWLKPGNAWVDVPVASEVAGAMFGEIWADLVIREIETSDMSSALCTLIEKERPSFLPGLCPAQDAILNVPLPDEITSDHE